MKDPIVLAFQIKEHRRALLELLLTIFPDVLTTKAKEVKQWRKKLRV
jgi:hypothetical protein